jgi:hypothetical protein
MKKITSLVIGLLLIVSVAFAGPLLTQPYKPKA